MKERQDRVIRAALSSLICTLVTATAHTVGGGSLPHPLVLGLALVLGIALCFGLGGRRVTLAHLVLAVGATQVVLHGAFASAGGGMASTSAAVPGGHAHGVTHVALDPATMTSAGHGGSMLLAHVISGLITVCSLRAGADALRRVVRAVGLRLGGVLARAVTVVAALGEPAVAPRPRPVLLAARPRRPAALVDTRIRSRRGPPPGVIPA